MDALTRDDGWLIFEMEIQLTYVQVTLILYLMGSRSLWRQKEEEGASVNLSNKTSVFIFSFLSHK